MKNEVTTWREQIGGCWWQVRHRRPDTSKKNHGGFIAFDFIRVVNTGSTMQFFAILNFVQSLLANEALRDAVASFVEFLNSLNDTERRAYVERFSPNGGFGNTFSAGELSGDKECCPPECQELEDAILEVLQTPQG